MHGRILHHLLGSSWNANACPESALAAIDILCRRKGAILGNESLVAITAFTDAEDAWTTRKAHEHAKSILSLSADRVTGAQFVVDVLLTGHLRPSFSLPRASRLASDGRPSWALPRSMAATGPMGRVDGHHEDHCAASITMFRWAIKESDVSLPM